MTSLIRAVAVVLHIHACIVSQFKCGTHAASASRHAHFGCTAVIHESDVCHWRVRVLLLLLFFLKHPRGGMRTTYL